MELTQQNLNTNKEKVYFTILLLLASVLWVGMPGWLIFHHKYTDLGVWAGLGLLFVFFAWLGNGLIVAHLRSNCIRVDQEQFPHLHKTLEDVCERLGAKVPHLFILQSQGFLNAFVMPLLKQGNFKLELALC